jgi:hypothetical protein
MARQLLGVTVLSLVLAACSSTPIDSSTEQGSTEEAAGSLTLPLTTQVGSITYRLRLASFVITGPNLKAARTVKPLDDAPYHLEKLPVGSYSIQLQNGWVLEKRDEAAGEKAYTAVKAQLVTDNPLVVDVDGKTVADAFFGFATTSGDVVLGDGAANIHIGVQDCSAYDSYTAALAELTVQCLGKLDPNSYGVTKDGFLAPRFEKCTGKVDKLRSIKQLLSLQQRTARLPFAKSCMAGRFDAALQKLNAAGITSCPSWSLDQVVNPINADVIGSIIQELPKIPDEGLKDDGKPLDVLSRLKVNSIYKVAFATTPPKQACDSAASCAMACASAFPGFALDTVGDSSVLTDPPAWLLDTVYPGTAQDPYLRAGYYHPMSWYPAPPGVQFGDFARFQPCGVNAEGNSVCNPEFCTYYAAGYHKVTKLQRDCLDATNPDTCNSFCGPTIIK